MLVPRILEGSWIGILMFHGCSSFLVAWHFSWIVSVFIKLIRFLGLQFGLLNVVHVSLTPINYEAWLQHRKTHKHIMRVLVIGELILKLFI